MTEGDFCGRLDPKGQENTASAPSSSGARQKGHIMYDVEFVTAILREAVAVKGEHHIQDECYYYAPRAYDEAPDLTQPECVVGTAFHLAGLGGLLVSPLDSIIDQQTNNGQTLPVVLPPGHFTEAATVILDRAQQLQDGRAYATNNSSVVSVPRGHHYPWGLAVQYATDSTIAVVNTY